MNGSPDLTDRCYVVGGASRGLGRAIAAELAGRGARVLLVARDQSALDAVAADLGTDRAQTCAVDLADRRAALRVDDIARATFGARLDGVVVNTGGPAPGHALEVDDADWQGAFDLLIGGPLQLLRVMTPRMSAGGAILFVTSSSVRQPIPGLDTSNVLRPGVAALAKTLAIQLGPRGIRVNSIAPGRFDTDRVRQLDTLRSEAAGRPLEEVRAEVDARVPLGRPGDPAEFARAAAFLLSDAASYVSGVALGVDGAAVTAQP